jgi:dihydroorotate dehydrogenase electron transfer subunit
MKQLVTKIAENKKVADNFYKMRIESAYLAKNSEPGQFVEVKVCDGITPLLRRPLGVHRILKTGIELLYEVVGKGTEILAGRKAGEEIDVIGPLGNGFTLNRSTGKLANRQTILVAGGIGVAPLLALAEKLLAGRPVSRLASLTVLVGACKKDHILCEKEFRKLDGRVLIATEDGSKGHKGLITDLLKRELSNRQTGKPANRHTTIYACGPVAMLKEAARIAKEHRARCQVSLEERMACGIGVCLGCPVKVTSYELRVTSYEYKMVCKDGPVFNAEDIIW